MSNLTVQLEEVKTLIQEKHQAGRHDQSSHTPKKYGKGGGGPGSATPDSEPWPTDTRWNKTLPPRTGGDSSFIKDATRRAAFDKIEGYYELGHSMSMYDARRSGMSPEGMRPYVERDELRKSYDETYGKSAFVKDEGAYVATGYIKPMRSEGMLTDKKGNAYGNLEVKRKNRWQPVSSVGDIRSGDPLRGNKYRSWNMRGGWEPGNKKKLTASDLVIDATDVESGYRVKTWFPK